MNSISVFVRGDYTAHSSERSIDKPKPEANTTDIGPSKLLYYCVKFRRLVSMDIGPNDYYWGSDKDFIFTFLPMKMYLRILH